MGNTACACGDEVESLQIANIEMVYRDKRLPNITIKDYKSEFEKEFFMTVNLLRENPLSFQTHIKTYLNQGKIDGDVNKMGNAVINKLKSLNKLEPVKIHTEASNACFVSMSKNENNPELIQNGAVKELSQMNKFVAGMDHKDWFKKSFRGSSLELVCDMLCTFYKTDSN